MLFIKPKTLQFTVSSVRGQKFGKYSHKVFIHMPFTFCLEVLKYFPVQIGTHESVSRNLYLRGFQFYLILTEKNSPSSFG